MKPSLRRKRWERAMRGHLREATDVMVEWWHLRCRREAPKRTRTGWQLNPGYYSGAMFSQGKGLCGRYEFGDVKWPQLMVSHRKSTKKAREKRHYPFMSPETMVMLLRARLSTQEKRAAALDVARELPDTIRAELALEVLEEEGEST